MESLEVLVDRARLDLPDVEERELCESYVVALQRLADCTDDPLYRLEMTRSTALLIDNVLQAKQRFLAWARETDVGVGGSTLLGLVSSIIARSRRVEAMHNVDEVLLVEDSSELPDALSALTCEEREDLAVLALASTIGVPVSASGDGQTDTRQLITRLSLGVSVEGNAAGKALVSCQGEDRSCEFLVPCVFVGDMDTFVEETDPVMVWLSAAGNVERYALAVNLMTLQIARSNMQTVVYSQWRFGSKFLEYAKDGGFLDQRDAAEGLVEKMAYAILGTTRMGNARGLRVNKKKGSRDRRRGKDKSKHANTGKTARLNYWKCANGSLEFGAPCALHDKQVLPD